MKFGLSPEEHRYICEVVIKPLTLNGAKVFCFGSRARGDHQAFSDLDLMVESHQDLSKEIGQLSEELTKGNFPYKVDLVELRNFSNHYLKTYQKEKIH